MRAFRLFACLVLAALIGASARAEESNFWPIRVDQKPGRGGTVESWQGGGPLFFGQGSADGSAAGGLRPIYVYRTDAASDSRESDFLYPLITDREGDAYRRWSLLSLINIAGPTTPGAAGTRHFDVWPVYFSRDTGNAATSYHAVFPLAGGVRDRLGYDRFSWVLFPLYGRFEKHGAVTTDTPWPFVKFIHGAGHHGFELWPLFGWRGKAGVYHDQYYLWPLIYRDESQLASPTPTVLLGVLPFYARDEGAGFRSETWLWPFFGYTHRQTPDRYDETRWFWPLLVQGRGDGRLVNRWAPFYTHSRYHGDDKHWWLWPLFRQEQWSESGLTITRSQLLYFLFWSQRERSPSRPALPPAEKTHLWPLLSYWDNGAGQRQCQVLSPFEVFFPTNQPVRDAWSPLFALLRYDQRAPGDARWSLLWDAVTWQRTPTRREFHLGPLLGLEHGPQAGRVALLGGLFGFRRGPAGGPWKPFLFDFLPKPDKRTAPAATP